MNARKQLAAAVVLACVGSGCGVADSSPAGSPAPASAPPANAPVATALAVSAPAVNVPAASAPAGPAVQLGIRWEPTLREAMARSGDSDPARPIVLLRVLGTLDDKL